MSESLEFNQYFPRKSFEISYALVRIASAVKSQSLRDHLEYHAFALLDKASSGKFSELYHHTAPLGYFLKLAAEGGLINPANAIAVSREIDQLNAAIGEFEKADTLPVFDLSGNFLILALPNRHQWPKSRRSIIFRRASRKKQRAPRS